MSFFYSSHVIFLYITNDVHRHRLSLCVCVGQLTSREREFRLELYTRTRVGLELYELTHLPLPPNHSVRLFFFFCLVKM